MKRIFFLWALLFCLANVSNAQLAAFPGAQGSGAANVGGRGGAVIEVTNLNDSGTGSLRACLQASGARTCVFRVGGTINVVGDLRIGNPFLTIAGQTAPGGGIKLAGEGAVMWVNTHDVIIRYISYDGNSVNNGPSNGSVSFDAGSGSSVYNVLFDHVSGFHVTNKQLIVLCNDVGPVKDVTFQWSMTYKPDKNHPVGPMADATTCRASGVTNIDYHHNFFADTSHRLPLFNVKSGRWVSNLIYNWDFFAGLWQGGTNPDIINNHYVAGNMNSGDNSGHPHALEFTNTQSTDDKFASMPGPPSIYLTGNLGPQGTDKAITGVVNSEGGGEVGSVPNAWFRGSPLTTQTFPITADAANTLDTVLLPTVGNSRQIQCDGTWKLRRQTEDASMITEYQNRSAGGLWTAPSGYSPSTVANGTACTESLHDGIPDQWKTSKGLSTSDTNLHNAIAPNGYTWLENYINGPDSTGSGSGGGTPFPALAISGISVTNVTSTTATINWTTNNPANSTVNYGVCNNLLPTPTNQTQVTSHVVNLSGLQAATTYTFNVESFDGTTTLISSNSAFTTSAAVATNPTQPAAPVLLTVSAPVQAFQLTWQSSPSSGVTKYRIYRSATKGTGYVMKAEVSGNVWTDFAVTSGQTLYYVVTAVAPADATPESAFSNELAVVIP